MTKQHRAVPADWLPAGVKGTVGDKSLSILAGGKSPVRFEFQHAAQQWSLQNGKIETKIRPIQAQGNVLGQDKNCM